MKAYSLKTDVGFSFLIHGWMDKGWTVVGKYPNGENDVINVSRFPGLNPADVDKVHEENYNKHR